MGAISSCFGRGRAPDDGNEDETRGLLHRPYHGGYGGIPAGDQPNSEAARREREALEGIYHSLSNNVFDVFTAQSQAQLPMSDSQDKSQSGSGPDHDDDLASEETKMRTVKKGRAGPVFSSMNRPKPGMTAIQAALG